MKKIFLVSNAHLDPVWQWQWQEGVACAISTFRTAADLCEQFEDYIFCHNEAVLYKWVEQYEPALFKRIKELVKKGRWRIMGGWYLQPDCNLISGESFVRQMEQGRRYFKNNFDSEPSVALNFDPFGHSKGMVQLLRLAGFDGYLICRPSPWDLDLKGNEDFTWNGFDGTSIRVHRSDAMYGSGMGHAVDKIKACFEKKEAAEDGDQVDLRANVDSSNDLACKLVLWGVGNHGGGPSRKDINDINAFKADCKDVEILHSYPEQYFSVASEQFKAIEVDTTLGRCLLGTYASQSRLKKKYRKAESEYYFTERICSAAALAGRMEYPAAELDAALEDVLFNQFHDILPGSSIEDAVEDSIAHIDRAVRSLSELYTKAYFALCDGLERVKDREYPIAVYNPYPYEVDTDITCEFMLYYENDGKGWQLPTVYDGETRLPVQLEKEDSNIPFDWRKRIVFRAHLEPMRVTRFSCYTNGGEKPKNPEMPADGIIKAGKTEVAFNKQGLLCSYKVEGKEYLEAPVVLRAYKDSEDSWGYFNQRIDDLQGEFTIVNFVTASRLAGVKAKELKPLRIIESGEVRTVVEGIYAYEDSWACVRYYISNYSSDIDIKVRLYCSHRDTCYKLEVPTNLKDTRFRGRVACGVEDLISDGREAVALSWISVTDNKRAVVLANDGCYGCSCDGGKLAQILVRTCAYCSHPGGEVLVPQDRLSPRADMGEHRFGFTLRAFDGADIGQEADRMAQRLNHPPYALNVYPSGEGEMVDTVLRVDGEVTLMAFKPALNGGYILRLFNPCDGARSAVVTLPDCSSEVSLRSMQVATYLYKDAALEQTDLIDY